MRSRRPNLAPALHVSSRARDGETSEEGLYALCRPRDAKKDREDCPQRPGLARIGGSLKDAGSQRGIKSETLRMIIRELTRLASLDLLTRIHLGRLACAKANQPYVFPVFFAYHQDSLYCASTIGQKTDLPIRRRRGTCAN
jgi:hypothetical protein